MIYIVVGTNKISVDLVPNFQELQVSHKTLHLSVCICVLVSGTLFKGRWKDRGRGRSKPFLEHRQEKAILYEVHTQKIDGL